MSPLQPHRYPMRIFFFLIITSLACNFGSQAGPTPTDAPPAIPSPTAQEEYVVLDLCSLLTVEEVGGVIGESVESSTDSGMANCAYTTTDMSATVGVSSAQGDEAKTLNLVGVQLILAFAGDAAVFESLNELMTNAEDLTVSEVIDATIQFQADIGAEVSSVDEFGSQAHWIWNPAGQYGTLMLVDGDTYLSFSMLGFEPDTGLQIATELVPLAKARLPEAFTVSTEGELGGDFHFEYSSEEPTEEVAAPQPTPTLSAPPAVWVTNHIDGAVSHIDPMTNQVVNTIMLKNGIEDIVASPKYVYVGNTGDSLVSWIDPVTETVVREVAIDRGPQVRLDVDSNYLYVTAAADGYMQIRDPETGALIEEFEYPQTWDIEASEYGVWFPAGEQRQYVVHLDPDSLTEIAKFEPGGQVLYVIFFQDHYWLGIFDSPLKLAKVDPETYEIVAVTEIEPKEEITHISAVGVGEGAVWMGFADGSLIKFDPNDGKEIIRKNITKTMSGIAVGYGSVWITDHMDNTVLRVDPITLEVVTRIPVGIKPAKLTVNP